MPLVFVCKSELNSKLNEFALIQCRSGPDFNIGDGSQRLTVLRFVGCKILGSPRLFDPIDLQQLHCDLRTEVITGVVAGFLLPRGGFDAKRSDLCGVIANVGNADAIFLRIAGVTDSICQAQHGAGFKLLVIRFLDIPVVDGILDFHVRSVGGHAQILAAHNPVGHHPGKGGGNKG